MLLHFAQSVPVESVLAAPATAVLGLVTVLLVIALAATLRALILKKRNGHEKPDPADEIAKNIALIERQGIDLPRNWRDWVDLRIQHKQRNKRANLLAYAHLIEHGKGERVAELLREEADEDE